MLFSVEGNITKSTFNQPLWHPKEHLLTVFQREQKKVAIENWKATYAIQCASESGYLQVVKELINLEGIQVNSNAIIGGPPLILATRNGHAEIVAELLKHESIEINSTYLGENALYVACEYRHLKIVKMLLRKGINTTCISTIVGLTPLLIASRCGHVEILNKLLEHGIDINEEVSRWGNAFVVASEAGQLEMVNYLIMKGIDINCKTKLSEHLPDIPCNPWYSNHELGKTALIVAVETGRLEIVKVLLNHGVNVNITEQSGKSAVFHASMKGYPLILEELLKHGALLNNARKSYPEPETPLHIACKRGHLEIVRKLVKNGININAQYYENLYLHH